MIFLYNLSLGLGTVKVHFKTDRPPITTGHAGQFSVDYILLGIKVQWYPDESHLTDTHLLIINERVEHLHSEREPK